MGKWEDVGERDLPRDSIEEGKVNGRKSEWPKEEEAGEQGGGMDYR